MLKLRLQRRGKKNYATFRVVVAEQHAPVKGRFIADVGSYNPHTNILTVNKDSVQEWLTRGAQPSATMHNLLITHGLMTGEKVTVWRPPQQQVEAPVTAPAEAAAGATKEAAAPETPAPSAPAPKDDTKNTEAPAATA